MSRLRVRLRGKTVHDLVLSPERTYVAGRKEDCDIVLQPEKGISREHIKISFADGQWSVELISRYGELIFNGEVAQQFKLSHGSQFIIAPYEFDFLEEQPEIESAPASEDSLHLPAVFSSDSQVMEANVEKTVVGPAPMAAYIKIMDQDGEVKEMLRLEAGESWVAGRDPSCHIQINDQRVSRRQFELRKAGNQYFILDLGSVNGTLVNGSPISSQEPTSLKSGDAISVLNNFIYFELHDAHFQNRLELVKASPVHALVTQEPESVPVAYQQPSPHEMVAYQNPYSQYQAPMPGPMAPSAKGKFDFEKNRPKIIGGAIALLVVAYFFSGGDSTSTPTAPKGGVAAPGSAQDTFNKLKPEQQALVRQRYKDAKNLYMQGKYQLAQDEIVKIQELVPDYEDIREIERLSKEAIFIQEQQRRQEQIEQAKLETEEKIQKQTAECQKQINPESTMSQLEDCLSSVLQFNPEHPKILELKSQVEQIISQREAKAAERAAFQSQVSRLRGIFEKAQAVHKTGKPLDAIAAYEKVLDSKLPDPNGYKKQSQRSIASLRQQMSSKTASLLAEADKYYQAQNLKEAILSLRKARVIDPTNTDLPDKIEKYTVELRKQMMTIYQEGILEESFGNVDGGESKAGAKEKWKKILDLDVPDGEYYKKAYLKLKKYGAL